jgi:hypothetical protein
VNGERRLSSVVYLAGLEPGTFQFSKPEMTLPESTELEIEILRWNSLNKRVLVQGLIS